MLKKVYLQGIIPKATKKQRETLDKMGIPYRRHINTREAWWLIRKEQCKTGTKPACNVSGKQGDKSDSSL